MEALINGEPYAATVFCRLEDFGPGNERTPIRRLELRPALRTRESTEFLRNRPQPKYVIALLCGGIFGLEITPSLTQ